MIIDSKYYTVLSLDSFASWLNSIQMSMKEQTLQKKAGNFSDQVICFVALMIGIWILPHALSKASIAKCPVGKPLFILHKYYEPGDFIIAGIFSQIYIFSSPISFQKPPSEEGFDDLV